jgi:tricorn protease-like protein
VVLGTNDGHLIFLDFPSFAVQSKVRLVSTEITAMCRIDNKTIAVSHSGQIYLIDVGSHEIKELPKSNFSAGAITETVYQPSSRILTAGYISPIQDQIQSMRIMEE